ncbi:MAG: MarR family transcriptional regulator [Ilumatobacteraceae bacterium]
MRRLLRPIGWTVWQAVLEHAVDTDGVLVAAVSVRSLADELGLAKDTVAAAIRRLIAHGLIERQPQTRHASRHPATTPSTRLPSRSHRSPRPFLPTLSQLLDHDISHHAHRPHPPDRHPYRFTICHPRIPDSTPASQLSLLDLQPTAPTPPYY